MLKGNAIGRSPFFVPAPHYLCGNRYLPMQLATKAIVLSSLKYGDTSLIVRAFTESSGLRSYMLKGILASKRGKMRPAQFLPLMQLELVVQHKDKGTLESMREAKVYWHYASLHTDMGKNALAFFLSEMLANSILEEEQNRPLFTFLEASLQWLDTHDKVANFHIYFLLSLTRFLGCYPDLSEAHLPYFDLVEGGFVGTAPSGPFMEGTDLEHFSAFLQLPMGAAMEHKMGRQARKTLLEAVITYYSLHLQGFKKPKSLAVLNDLFA